MRSKLFLVCVLACFLATRGEGLFRILGGAIARPREFQYVVGIGRFAETGDAGHCTGGIIDEKFVLTAAHCVTKVVENYDFVTHSSEIFDGWMFVYANTTNYSKDLEKNKIEARSGSNRTTTSTAITRRAVKAYILSEYLTNGVADIAILELDSPLKLNDGYLQKLKLPTGRKISYEGAHAVLAGFGKDRYSFDGRDMNNGTLKKAHFRILPDSRCHYSNRDLFKHSRFCMIAVTEENEHPDQPLGACKGDSGGPIVHGNTVIGIMQGGSARTCDGREPEDAWNWIAPQNSVKVEYYKNFINNVIGNRHLRPGNNQSITQFKLRA